MSEPKRPGLMTANKRDDDSEVSLRHPLGWRIMIRVTFIILFAAIGPFFGLLSFIFGFFVLKFLTNENLQHDDFFALDTVALVYVVGLIPALAVGIASSYVVDGNGYFSLKRVVISAVTVGLLMSIPMLFMGNNIPSSSPFLNVQYIAMIIWVNVGAAILSWLIWELTRCMVCMVRKERKA